MGDQRTMAELLQKLTEGYGDAFFIPVILSENFELKHSLLNPVTSKQFCGFEKEDPQAHIPAVGNLLTKTPKDALTIIENKLKVHTSRNRPVVSKVSMNTSTPGLSPDVAALIDAVKALLLKNTTPPPASIKAVEESCVTCGGPHLYYQCLATDGNASGYQDNIQAYVSTAAVNYNQGNVGPHPLSVAHQVRPPGFPLVQNNQNRGNNYNQGNSTYRALTQPTQAALSNELLMDQSTTRPTDIAEDVFVRVGKFHFLADFVVADYVVNPQVPLILGRPFLRTARALIDVYGEELTLRVSDEAITFKVVLGVSDNSESGNPTPTSEPIIAKSSPSLTPFKGGDFILEEVEAYLVSDSVPPRIDDAEFDLEGDIRLIEEMLNNYPYSPLPPKDLKCEELKSGKSSVDEPPELELKDLPSQLEYAFLEGTNKLPVIIAKNLKDEENERLIKVLKSHKQAITWKLSDIKGIDP
ncbi:reverse transcriptase domain-containing protein [Tanacetum coccineum]